MSTFNFDTEAVGMGAALTVVLIGPHESRRRAIAKVFAGNQARLAREFSSYPRVDEIGPILEADYDVVLVDLDPDPEQALDVVEAICAASGKIIVIVYSAHTDSEMLVRCMRAGAREFLTEPVQASAAAEALVRASVRRDELRRVRKGLGKLLVFAGAKGGCGVTTLASNFALGMTKEWEAHAPGTRVALLDLSLQLGDCALLLGIKPKFSAADALDNIQRVDSDFLSVMMAKHSSGLSVLSSLDGISKHLPNRNALEQLIRVCRENFQYVLVDAGVCVPEVHQFLFEAATTVYLVLQVSVSELRNANRIITHHFAGANQPKLEIVLNRFSARTLELDEAALTKALTRPVKWKIPNDHTAARRAQNTGIPLVVEETELGQSIRQMASACTGLTLAKEKKKRFGLFR